MITEKGIHVLAHSLNLGLETYARTDFRGVYEGFDLIIADKADTNWDPKPNCFSHHIRGDDGLWVVETKKAEKADKFVASIKAAGFKVLYRAASGLSFVATGGEDVMNIEGLEECGEDADTAVIPVPNHTVPSALLKAGPAFPGTCCSGVNPAVKALVDAVSQDRLKAHVQGLQDFGTRNSYSLTKTKDVLEHIHAKAKALGLSTSSFSFREDMGPNIIVEKKGKSSELVILGGHYDSRNTDSRDATGLAPGADDNGSGSAGILEVMDLLSKVETERTIRFMWFCGEEQGLIGSRAIAAHYAETKQSVYAMVNMDMVGYKLPTKEIHIAFMDRSMSTQLTEYVANVTNTYLSGMSVTTELTSACCSDQQGFYEYGFPSMGYFENSGGAGDYPQYHKKGDTIENVNLDQLTTFTKSIVSSVAELAGVSATQIPIAV